MSPEDSWFAIRFDSNLQRSRVVVSDRYLLK
jgi:hypothetical protein